MKGKRREMVKGGRINCKAFFVVVIRFSHPRHPEDTVLQHCVYDGVLYCRGCTATSVR